MGFFYAWDGALRYTDDRTVCVNLLLNRASPWMDVDSYLPYEGKIVLRNKTAHEAFVRIPLWVEKKLVESRVGRAAARPDWFDRYLHFEHLHEGDVITIEFPVNETSEKWAADDKVYVCRFKGNTLVDVAPSMSPLYNGRAAKYKATHASTRKVSRFVSPVVLKW